MNFTLGELASRLDGELRGDARTLISGMAPLSHAQPGQISFLANSKYQQQLSTTSASAVLVRASDAEACPVDCIVVSDPYLAFAKTVEILNPVTKHPAGIHASAVIAEGCAIDDSAWIGPNCVIEAGSVISSGVQLSAGCVIGANCTISRDSTLKANVTVYHGCVIGERAIIHSGAVIGSDGFGFANDKGRWHKIQQIGRVVIGNDVEIGANTTIDRGAIEDTVIEDGVKLDNLIQIAHNVRIGAHTAMAGHSAVAGSTTIGHHCAIGGAVGIVGHLKICDNVTVTAMSLVSKSITKAGVYSSGMPVEANPEWNKRVARIRQLDELTKRVRQLEQQITK